MTVAGSRVREVLGLTYTNSRVDFDSAQRISNAWYFEPESIDRALAALERKGLLRVGRFASCLNGHTGISMKRLGILTGLKCKFVSRKSVWRSGFRSGIDSWKL